jgi:two-component system, NtrC family, response regulator GlrR
MIGSMRAPVEPTLEHGRAVTRRRPRVQLVSKDPWPERRIEARTLVGSADAAAICVADRTVSRLHAELEPRDDGLWVRDLGSRNGTFVDEVRVECGRVGPGGRIRLGSSVFVVSYDAVASPVELYAAERFGSLIGRSDVMRELFALLARVAASEASVLVVGETGTGKELVARSLHDASPRGPQPFVVVDCAALPENLLEAELFGHARGAFTGAASARAGAIEDADGGTVFLDEIGELPLSVQPKLLRVLESREVRRLGETAHRKVNVRFISATHRDLRQMVNANAFREDLYFRLAVLVVGVPPLRERPEDIPLLVTHILGDHEPLPAELLAEIEGRPWLGNVRELRNFVERARALGAHQALAMSPPGDGRPRAPAELGAIDLDRPYKSVRDDFVERFERAYFRQLLERHGRNVAEAAKAAGVDRSYVYRLVRRYDL